MRSLPVLRSSATTRWMNCTWFSAHEWPESESSEAAARGTRVHNTIAKVLGAKPEGELAVTDDEAALTTVGVSYAETLMEGVSSDWVKLIEYTMNWASQSGEDQIQGTVDFALVSPDGEYAVIVDWKTGQRHGGYEDQMRTYAWLLRWAFPKLAKVDVRLVYLASGEEDRMVIHGEDLAAHGVRLMGALSDRSETQPAATPGHWCQWCPGALSCPKNAAIEKAVTEASMLRVDVSKLALSVSTEDEAVVAHALLTYANDVIEKIEKNLKAYVREHGGSIQTREGQRYKVGQTSRSTLNVTPAALEAIEKAGAGECIKPAASWADIKKKLAKNAVALETLEAALTAHGALTTKEYETWTTR